jgi:hypothetical protein
LGYMNVSNTKVITIFINLDGEEELVINTIQVQMTFKTSIPTSTKTQIIISRVYKVLTMVYNIQSFWVFGLFHRPVSQSLDPRGPSE